MANKETISEFLANMKNWPNAIQKRALSKFDLRKGQALGQAVIFAPEDTGALKKQTISPKAKLTPTGIYSSFSFIASSKGFYYPYWVNEGTRPDGTPITIKKGKNPNAQAGFADKGIPQASNDLMMDLTKIIEEVFIQS